MKLKGISIKNTNGYVFEAYSYECLGNLCQFEAVKVSSLNCFPVCETWSALILSVAHVMHVLLYYTGGTYDVYI